MAMGRLPPNQSESHKLLGKRSDSFVASTTAPVLTRTKNSNPRERMDFSSCLSLRQLQCGIACCLLGFMIALVLCLAVFSFLGVPQPQSLLKKPGDRIPKTAASSTGIHLRGFVKNSTLNTTTMTGDDLDSVPTFAIVCGTGDTDSVKEMIPLLKSMLLLSSTKLNFVFLTDTASASRLKTLFRDDLRHYKIQSVDIRIVARTIIEELSLRINYNYKYHHSGLWGTTKLFLPWLLPEYQRVVVVDTDMVFIIDPALLWNEFDVQQPSASAVSTTKEPQQPWVYRMPLLTFESNANICSCVVLIDLEEARVKHIYPDRFRAALEAEPTWLVDGLYQAPHGDQGLYYSMFHQDMSLVLSLSDKWDRDKCHFYGGQTQFRWSRYDKETGLLHKNCDHGEVDSASKYFDFFGSYPAAWLGGGTEAIPAITVSQVHSII